MTSDLRTFSRRQNTLLRYQKMTPSAVDTENRRVAISQQYADSVVFQGGKRSAKLHSVLKTQKPPPVVFTTPWAGPCIATYTAFSQETENEAAPARPSLPPFSARHVSSQPALSKSESYPCSSLVSPTSTRYSTSARTLPADVNAIRTVSTRLAVPPPRQTLRRHIQRQIEALRPCRRDDDAVRIYRALDLSRHIRPDKHHSSAGPEKKLFSSKKRENHSCDLERWIRINNQAQSLSPLINKTDRVESKTAGKDFEFFNSTEPQRDLLSNMPEAQRTKCLRSECGLEIFNNLPDETDTPEALQAASTDRLPIVPGPQDSFNVGNADFTPEFLLEGLVRQLEEAGSVSRRSLQQTGSRFSWVPLSICSL
ncbi:hypothetical protein ElyMa_004622400 [Elysia marginata]|uniref:Uncharacterized protein n=1 Tax=Elysia marginata TaxID=1093978 RepID=A0AAV4HZ99_9GAST|nr:hypothetical protein ElyMa_004622400 [Elysia marginata]